MSNLDYDSSLLGLRKSFEDYKVKARLESDASCRLVEASDKNLLDSITMANELTYELSASRGRFLIA